MKGWRLYTPKGICQSIWRDSSVSWDYVPSSQAAGGLLCLWNNAVFLVDRKVKGAKFLMLEGRCVNSNQKMFVVNVYAPCDLAGKRLLWDDLKQLRVSNPPGLWCFMGDFNSIRSQDERLSLSQRSADTLGISEFNQWISDMDLQEIKCAGCSFTWIRPNGSVKSRLDRFLVSDQWLLSWPDSCQYNLPRDFSDHCPIIMQTKKVDWGPKLFRVVDWWIHQKGYHSMVREAWNSDQQGGWGGIVLKNKLRNLKMAIKHWSQEYGNINAKEIQKIQQKLNDVEDLASTRILSEDEIKVRRSLQQQLWDASTAYESLLRQKSRSKWLQEGDSNSAFFHKVINFRRNYNALQGILIDGLWVQQPEEVKKGAVDFFLKRFTEQNPSRPTLDGVQFPSLDQRQREGLILPFSDQELKEAVWSCGGDKCPGPDGFNFNFIKEFWGVLKPEFRRFVDEFHINGIFTWRLLKDRLPTRANLLRRNVVIQDTVCPLCGLDQEEVGHLFFNCKRIVGLWWESMTWVQVQGPLPATPVDHFLQFCDGFGAHINHSSWCGWWVALTSTIWQHRNLLIFHEKPFDPSKVMEDALFLAWSWLKARQKGFNTSFNQWSSHISDSFG
ncbi:Transposon TX1 uncharacterized protein [Glycine soja]